MWLLSYQMIIQLEYSGNALLTKFDLMLQNFPLVDE